MTNIYKDDNGCGRGLNHDYNIIHTSSGVYRGLYRGLGPNIGRNGIVNACETVVYDVTKVHRLSCRLHQTKFQTFSLELSDHQKPAA